MREQIVEPWTSIIVHERDKAQHHINEMCDGDHPSPFALFPIGVIEAIYNREVKPYETIN